jgi:hypothetical protein
MSANTYTLTGDQVAEAKQTCHDCASIMSVIEAALHSDKEPPAPEHLDVLLGMARASMLRTADVLDRIKPEPPQMTT